jgi:hypothetical protein
VKALHAAGAQVIRETASGETDSSPDARGDQRGENGEETVRDIAQSYNVSYSTISRLSVGVDIGTVMADAKRA